MTIGFIGDVETKIVDKMMDSMDRPPNVHPCYRNYWKLFSTPKYGAQRDPSLLHKHILHMPRQMLSVWTVRWNLGKLSNGLSIMCVIVDAIEILFADGGAYP